MSDPRYDGAVLDLDGTVYLGGSLIDGAAGAIRMIRMADLSVLFLTNKPIARREDYYEKLVSFGIPTTIENVINSSSVAATYLQSHHETDPILVVGEDPLSEELRTVGLTLTDDPVEAQVVLVSMDREFDYETLSKALYALDDDTTFLATNPDRTCPTADGEIPDCRAMTGAIEGATGREVDRVLGKPAETAMNAAMKRLDTRPERCLMIGDRLETDVRMGNRSGMTTVLVLSGATDRETVADSGIRPDHVIESIANIDVVLD
jgi:arabinose operon protein AraL